jgi:hypothetical protein
MPEPATDGPDAAGDMALVKVVLPRPLFPRSRLTFGNFGASSPLVGLRFWWENSIRALRKVRKLLMLIDSICISPPYKRIFLYVHHESVKQKPDCLILDSILDRERQNLHALFSTTENPAAGFF